MKWPTFVPIRRPVVMVTPKFVKIQKFAKMLSKINQPNLGVANFLYRVIRGQKSYLHRTVSFRRLVGGSKNV